VYYVENSILDPARHHRHDPNDLVIPNSDPLTFEEETEVPAVLSSSAVPVTAAASGASASNNYPNNLLSRPRCQFYASTI
jgi:hypothetical protein